MEEITVLKATVNDLEKLRKIGKQTFIETFSGANTEENMRIYLEKSFSTEVLKAELNDKNSEIYFADNANETIGYVKLNFGSSQTELKDKNTMEIERIYVSKELHGKKVGQILYDKAMEVAGKRNADFVWLGVWEKNLRAISFYKKNGFEVFDKHIFILGNDVQTDIMMKKTLSN
jgi:ribosomal protein S18 acetylase RimI-like enzyme